VQALKSSSNVPCESIFKGRSRRSFKCALKKVSKKFFKCAPKKTNTSFEKGFQLYKKIKMGKTSFKEVLQVCPNKQMAQKAPKKSLKHAQTKEKCINKFQRSLSNVPNQRTIAKNNLNKSLKCAQKKLKLTKLNQRSPSSVPKQTNGPKSSKEVLQACPN
jgi:hypothetical protein